MRQVILSIGVGVLLAFGVTSCGQPKLSFQDRYAMAQGYLIQKRYAVASQHFKILYDSRPESFMVNHGLATAAAGMGDMQSAVHYTRKCFQIDPRKTEYSIVSISTPFWETPALYQAGVDYYKAVAFLIPDRPWIQTNIETLEFKIKQRTGH